MLVKKNTESIKVMHLLAEVAKPEEPTRVPRYWARVGVGGNINTINTSQANHTRAWKTDRQRKREIDRDRDRERLRGRKTKNVV